VATSFILVFLSLSLSLSLLRTVAEWLFLAPPDPVQLKALRRRVAKRKGFDKDGLSTLGCTAVDVGGLLMLFFAELENPLLTVELHDCWLASVGIVDVRARVICLKKVVDLLPAVNAAILLQLVDFFSIVVQVNKVLDVKKLAELFAPLLLRPLDGSGDLVPTTHPSVSSRTRLVDHPHSVKLSTSGSRRLRCLPMCCVSCLLLTDVVVFVCACVCFVSVCSFLVIELLIEHEDFLFHDKELVLPTQPNPVDESDGESAALKREASLIFDEQYKYDAQSVLAEWSGVE
jgi:RhoGAP domain